MTIKPKLPPLAMAALITALGGAAHAQALRITNAAAGIACYSPQNLLSAHGAIGYYNLDKVRVLAA